MNVLLVIPFATNGTAGVGRIVLDLQESLRRRGFKAYLLMAGTTNSLGNVQALNRDDVYEIHYRFMWPNSPKAFLGFWFYLPKILLELARFLRHNRIDVVHINFPSAVLVYFAILRPFARWRLVSTLLGSDINNLPNQGAIWRAFVKFILDRTDIITACSKSLLEKLGKLSGQYLKKALLIPNANPLNGAASWGPASLPFSDAFVLSVGSLIHRKGHDILIRAIGLAKKRGFRIKVVIVGGGPGKETLRGLAEELGVSDQIEIAGEVKHELMDDYYAKCRYFALATRAEGLPVAIMEAMGFGKTVVATNVDGIPDIVIDGDNGLLVPAENPEALASAMMRLESDENLRGKLGSRARELIVSQHTWAHFTDRTIGAYHAAFGRNPTDSIAAGRLVGE